MIPKIKKISKHILLPLVFGLGIGGFTTVFFYWNHIQSWHNVFEQIFYSVILSFLFWKGNELIIRILSKKYSWVENTSKIITRHFIFTFSYSMLVIMLFYLYIWFFLKHKTNLDHFVEYNRMGFYFCFSITAICVLASYVFYFFKYWRKAVLGEEQQKRESLALQYESLKNQVNPHFLFNSLNTLTSLIERDQIASVKYVKQLSDVLRYVLDQNGRELVPIATELKFIESYIYLLQIRLSDNFRIQIDIQKKNFHVVPLAIQILLENVVKHNEISSDKPLNVRIYDTDDYLIIENTLQPKAYMPDSSKLGLKNINFQYHFLSGKNIEITNENDCFVVKLPKIKT